MAYVAPTTRATGYVVPASTWNSDVVDNVIAIKAQIDALAVGGKYACDGRLSLTTGVPVTTSDVTAAGTLYWVPYTGNQLSLYSGSAWVMFSQAELSIAVPANANQVFDAFIDYNSGTPALSFTPWTNDTTRATALTTQDGVLVLTGATTKRYVGTVRTVTASQLNDSLLLRHVWNYYNRVPRPLERRESTGNWVYTTAVWRQANNAAANQVSYVIGVAETLVSLAVGVGSGNASNAANCVAIGHDSTSTPHASCVGSENYPNGSSVIHHVSTLSLYPAVGYHYDAWLEYSAATGTTTWYSTNILTAAAGITGSLNA